MPRFLQHLNRIVGKNLLLTSTISSVLLGIALGVLLRPLNLSNETCMLINFPGEIFMRILKMMILPLIFSSLTSAIAQMNVRESGVMGFATVLYYIITGILATILGISLVLLIRPGEVLVRKNTLNVTSNETDIYPLDTLLDMIRNMFPENILQASFQRLQTTYTIVRPVYKKANRNVTNETLKIVKKLKLARGTNILGIIVFCTGFGIIMSRLGERALVLINFFAILDSVITRWVEALMWLAPIGITCLIAGSLLEMQDLGETAQVLFLYVLTVICGLLTHTFVIMPGIYFLVTRKNPLYVMKSMLQALVTAFGTGSSGAALPSSMQCLEEGFGVDRRITRFVLPLGTTINMDGNALYEAVAVIFIAQLNGISLSMTEIITVSFIASISSIGMGSVPAGLVAMLLILNTIGLPNKDIPLLLSVDWLIDRIRTGVNVLGDGYVAASIAHLLRHKERQSECVSDHRGDAEERMEFIDLPLASRHHSYYCSRNPSLCSSLIAASSRRASLPEFFTRKYSWKRF